MSDNKTQQLIAATLKQLTGNHAANDQTLELIRQRLTQRMKLVGKANIEEYLADAPSSRTESHHLVHVLTIHTTSWFREASAFVALATHLESARDPKQAYKGLIVGCSTGQEAYSIAMYLRLKNAQRPISLTAVDIDPISIDFARRAVYSATEIEHIAPQYHQFLKKGSGSTAGLFTLDEEIIESIEFVEQNVLDLNLGSEKFDFVFCRNMLIYFELQTIPEILERLLAHLKPSGLLCLGASESIDHLKHNLVVAGPSSYVKGGAEKKLSVRNALPLGICIVDTSLSSEVGRFNDFRVIRIEGQRTSSAGQDKLSGKLLRDENVASIVVLGVPPVNCLDLRYYFGMGFHFHIITKGTEDEFFHAQKYFIDEIHDVIAIQELPGLISRLKLESPRSDLSKSSPLVFLVDDDPDILEFLQAALETAEFQVEAFLTGKNLLDRVNDTKPDLVVTDFQMPDMNGIRLIRNVRAKHPDMPVILLSGQIEHRIDLSIQAEFTVLQKPIAIEHFLGHCTHMVGRLRLGYRPRVIASACPELIAIGASTGGPRALQVILEGLNDAPCPIVIVQHMGAHFHQQFYQQLAKLSGLTLQIVDRRLELTSRQIYAPAPNMHIQVFEDGKTIFAAPLDLPEQHGHRPAVDPLFLSIADRVERNSLAILLTGMGRDGAVGLKAMRDAGHLTIAQDKESCTVYGMPREAIEMQAAVMVANLEEIRRALHVDAFAARIKAS